MKGMLHKAFENNLSLKALLFNEGVKAKIDALKAQKQKFLHDIKVIGQTKNINHYTSPHVREVQYSDFILLDSGAHQEEQTDNNGMHGKKLKDFQTIQKDEKTGKRVFDLNDDANVFDNTQKIHMKFLNKREV